MESITDLENVIIERSKKRGLHADMQKIRYSITEFYRHIPQEYRKTAIYVGVGHGLDALLALLDGWVENIIGIDPYQHGGNDEEDYENLNALITKYDVNHRFTVIKGTIEEYLKQQNQNVELIICSDVLHHIFETEELLSKSVSFDSAVTLFAHFKQACHGKGMLAISDVQRNGLRPFLTKIGMLQGQVNYKKKQPWQEWNRAATQAGWAFINRENYIPFTFHKQANVWQNPLALYTLCDRYFLYYKSNSQQKDE